MNSSELQSSAKCRKYVFIKNIIFLSKHKHGAHRFWHSAGRGSTSGRLKIINFHDFESPESKKNTFFYHKLYFSRLQPQNPTHISRFLWQTCLIQMHKSQSPIFPYILARIFKNPKKVPQKWPKRGSKSITPLGTYSIIPRSVLKTENRTSR